MERTASQSRLLRGIFDRLRPGRVEVTGGFLLLAAWLNYLDRQHLVPLAAAACELSSAPDGEALSAVTSRDSGWKPLIPPGSFSSYASWYSSRQA